MTDERIVEVMARKLLALDLMQMLAEEAASEVLAALRGAGFDVYRPDDASTGWWCAERRNPDAYTSECFDAGEREERIAFGFGEHKRCGTYRLVPVGGDS